MPFPASPTATARADATRVLRDTVYDGWFETVHRPLRDLLAHPLFERREGLTALAQGRLAYDRSRFVHSRLGDPRDVLADPQRMFALSEWPSLLDTTTLPLLMSHYNLCLGTVLQHSHDRTDLDDWIDELAAMRSVGMLMVSELGYGNNAAAMRTRAEYDPADNCFRLVTPDASAQKFMPYTGVQNIPKIAVVMARLIVSGEDCGVFPFLVRISDTNGLRPGVVARPLPEKPGLALDNGVTWFDGVRLERRALLAGSAGRLSPDGVFTSPYRNRRRRFLSSLERVQPGRLCLASSLVAASRAACTIAVRHSLRRHTSAPAHKDVPLLAYRSQQVDLFGALADTYAMTFLVNDTKRTYEAAPEAPETHRQIAVCKAVSSWTVTAALTQLRERIGAQGMFAANRIAEYIPMAQGVVTAEGDNLPLLAKAGNELIVDLAATPAPPLPAHGSLTDPAYHLALVRSHQHELALRSAAQMRRRTRAGASLFDVWNSQITTALDVAAAHGTARALAEFGRIAACTPNPRARRALRKLAAFYALRATAPYRARLLSRGLITPAQTDRCDALAERLLSLLLPDAELLVDAFALPDTLLRAPALSPDLSYFHPAPGTLVPATDRDTV
ncbi:acyl-CoA dehydrogenase [Streptomyces sp. NPDC059698]|uniref:acyl-CoA dehydrogenase family protein n=1 Tax=unclassified Streptomyces TaxID=2593676 RepID=UPI00093F8FE1|nr:acyl-CoA dehydrogenase [Streptomyces sp. CB02366]